MTHVHILRVKNSISCTFVGGESHRERCIYQREEDIFFFLMRKLSFVCFTLCLFSCCFMVLWVLFSIYVLLLSLHRVYALDMHTSLCYCALLVACSDDHLLCYVIIVVISICLWGSNAFYASVSGYRYFVQSSSQVLNLGVSEICYCFQTHV